MPESYTFLEEETDFPIPGIPTSQRSICGRLSPLDLVKSKGVSLQEVASSAPPGWWRMEMRPEERRECQNGEVRPKKTRGDMVFFVFFEEARLMLEAKIQKKVKK